MRSIELFKNMKKKIDNEKVKELLIKTIEDNDIKSFDYIFINSDFKNNKKFKFLKEKIIKDKKYDFLEICIKNNPLINEKFYSYFNKKEYKVILLYIRYNNENLKIIDIFKEQILCKIRNEDNDDFEIIKILIQLIEENKSIYNYFEELKMKNENEYNEIFENNKYLEYINYLSIVNF